MPGHPKYVRATCFPMRPSITEKKVGAALSELVQAGFVIRYDLKGRVFLQVDRWFDLQGKWGQRRTYPSRYPAPPGWTSDWVTAGSDEEVRAPGALGAGSTPAPFTSPSATSFPLSIAGLDEARSTAGQPERLEHLLERAKQHLLTEEEAIEVGTLVADPRERAG